MNILVTINDYYVKYLHVMLCSLFDNHNERFTVYCLYDCLSKENQRELRHMVEDYRHKISFIRIDKQIYRYFPVNEALAVKCYYILLAHQFLPTEMERILYLDADLIIDGDLQELYAVEMEEKYLAVCGQSYKKMNGHYYHIGARPEREECFDSGVILFNLRKMREDICADTYLEAAEKNGYNFSRSDRGILNIVFWDKCVYLDTLKYNFRTEIYEDYLKDGNTSPVKPCIYHFKARDNYRIGHRGKPWTLTLNPFEYRLLHACGMAQVPDQLRPLEKFNQQMYQKWWDYAKKTVYYTQMKASMKKERAKILEGVLEHKTGIELIELMQKNSQRKYMLGRLTADSQTEVDTSITYAELEQYIDSLPAEKAISTMRNLFQRNCKILCRKERIRVGFLVYSTSEWQCEEIYRLLEKDGRFEPYIIACGYGHGTPESKRSTYIDVCNFFSGSHWVVYAGYMIDSMESAADSFDILVYITPFSALCPEEFNVKHRKIRQLCVHIPYAFYLVDKRDVTYNNFYNAALFKLGWKYFCSGELQKSIVKSEQRLEAYNVEASGISKMDAFLKGTPPVQKGMWKNTGIPQLKVIWAPHFNLERGMNGTFHENYQWFFEYAKEHPEISWIVRPHPRMEWGAVYFGIFKSADEYRAYLDRWDGLSNARVLERGEYFDIFSTSDAMILDSVSFIAEYQFVGKPLLRLMPEVGRSMNILGERLDETLYHCRGNDFSAIEAFLDHTAKGEDPMKERRSAFFLQYLNHKAITGMYAAEYIYRSIVKDIFGLQEAES